MLRENEKFHNVLNHQQAVYSLLVEVFRAPGESPDGPIYVVARCFNILNSKAGGELGLRTPINKVVELLTLNTLNHNVILCSQFCQVSYCQYKIKY